MITLAELSPIAIKQKYGNVLFGSNSKLAVRQNKDPEKDTKDEAKLYKILLSWYSNSDEISMGNLHKSLDDLLALEDEFPDVLRPNYGHNAYRGTTQNLRPLRSWLVLNPKKRLVYNNYYQFTTPYPYQPKRKISSWSEEFHVANRFSDSENRDEVSVVFTTKVDDSFIMNPYASDDIFTGGNEDVAEEREIFKFEPEGTYYLIIYKDELNTMGL